MVVLVGESKEFLASRPDQAGSTVLVSGDGTSYFPLAQVTSDELRGAVAAVKQQAIARLEAYFIQHPAPISNVERLDDEPVSLNLLDYQVAVRKYNSVAIVEVSQYGFIYEPDYGERGWDSYAVLDVGAVLDLLAVVERLGTEPPAEA